MSRWPLPTRGRRRVVAVLLSLGLLGLAVPSAAQADEVDDARRQVTKVQDQLERLEEQVSILEEDLRQAEQQLVDAQAEVEASKARIAALETKLSEVRAELGDLALKTFISGDQASGASSLFTGSGDITEVVEREQYAKLAMSAGESSTDELDATITDLEAERQVLEVVEAMAENLVEDVTDAQQARDDAEAAAEDALTQAKADLGQALVDEQARRQQALLAQAAAAQAEAASRLGNQGGGGGAGGGGAGGNTGGGGTSSGNDSSSSSGNAGNSGAGSYVPSPSPGASGAVSAASSQVGVGYRYASASPGEAFDCSGLTYWAWSQAGVTLPRNSRAQYAATTHISPSEAQPGDLIFFYNPISHVGLYIGGGVMVDAANHSLGVRQTAVNWSRVVGVGRPG